MTIDPAKTTHSLREALDDLADRELGAILILSLAGISCLLLAPTPLPTGVATFLQVPTGAVQLLLLMVGATLLSTGIWLHRRGRDLRRRGAPNTNAIKGTSHWTPPDHELFHELGRGPDFTALASWVQDINAAPALNLVAPEGMGKTSLLRAGLIPVVINTGYHAVYWSATADEPGAKLLRMIRDTWNLSSAPPSSLGELRERLKAQPILIVIDDAENLPDTADNIILEEIKEAYLAGPPHRQTWLLSFNENCMRPGYLSPTSPRLISLGVRSEHLMGLDLAAARHAIEAISEKAGIDDRARAITSALENWTHHGTISPSDLSLLLHMSYTLPIETSDFLLSRNGPLQLTRHYLSHHLSRLRQPERTIAQRLLTHLATKPEGVSAEDLAAELEIATQQATQLLNRLSSREPQIVKATEHRYTLGHPRFVQAAQNLNPQTLAHYQAEHLQSREALWRQDGRPRNLLLPKSVLKRLDYEAIPPDSLPYVRASQRWRRVRLARSVGIAILVICLALAFQYLALQGQKTQLMLGWGLPTDLPSAQDQLLKLHLTGNVHRLNWLHADLATLGLSGSKVSDLRFVPGSVSMLSLNFLQPRQRLNAQLPPNLTHLDLRYSPLRTAEAKPPANLTHLALGGAPDELSLLPSSIDFLVLEKTGHTVITDLPARLRHLTIEDAALQRLDGVPDGLEFLSVSSTALAELPPLPASLRHLRLLRNWHLRLPTFPIPVLETVAVEAPPPDAQPDTLDHVLQFIAGLPADLQCLSLGNFSVDSSRLPPNLSALAMHGNRTVTEPLRLPQTLHALSLRSYEGSLEGLPPRLVFLDISYSGRTLLPPLPPTLRELNITTTAVTQWGSAAPPNLTSLIYRNSAVKRLLPLPGTLRELDIARARGFSELSDLPTTLEVLDVSGSEIAVIEWPPNLRVVNIANSHVTDIAGLPDTVESLTLHLGQLDRLGTLPAALTELRFVAAEFPRDHAADAPGTAETAERTICDRELDLWP